MGMNGDFTCGAMMATSTGVMRVLIQELSRASR
jgi:hypothetical protein